MSEHRRATVMVIQSGDREIAGAALRGILAAKGNGWGAPLPSLPERCEHFPGNPPSPQGEGFREAEGCRAAAEDCREASAGTVEIMAVQVDYRKIAQRLKVAIGNDRTPEDYRDLIIKARGDYAPRRLPGPLRTLSAKLLLAWVMLCQGIRRAYRAQDRLLK